MFRTALANARRASVAAILSVLGFATAAFGQVTLYVDGSCGDDAWTGLSPVCQAPNGPKATIQAGLNAGQTGDTVIVADGRYIGLGNGLLSFPGGQNFTLRSANGPETCVIDLENAGLGFFLIADETPETVVDGFTITNGNASTGGAIYCHRNGRPTFRNCIITGNRAQSGGAIVCGDSSSPTFINCTITGNTAERGFGGAVAIGTVTSSPTFINCTISSNTALLDGGGVWCQVIGPGPTLINCVVADNIAGRDGGGVYCARHVAGLETTFINCTIANNTANRAGGGIFIPTGNPARVTNCILWGNSGAQISGGEVTVTYSNVAGGHAGTGNINADPRFVDPANGNYRLSPGSPVIDAADNTAVPPGITTDRDGNPRFVDDPATPDTGNGAPPIVDMGAFEFQSSPFRRGDLNCDGAINGADIDPFFLALGDPAAYMAQFPNCNILNGDMNLDGRVNGADIDPFFVCLGGGGCP